MPFDHKKRIVFQEISQSQQKIELVIYYLATTGNIAKNKNCPKNKLSQGLFL